MCDETSSTDKGKSMCGVAIGSLDDARLHHTVQLTTDEKTPNAKKVVEHIESALMKLFPNALDATKVKLFVSDSASTMKKAARLLSIKYPAMVAVTCCTHALHLTCEQLRHEFPLTDEFIGLLKRVMCNSYDRKVTFRNCSNEPGSSKSTSIPEQQCGELFDQQVVNQIAQEHDYATLSQEFKSAPLSSEFTYYVVTNEKASQFILKSTLASDETVLDSAPIDRAATIITSIEQGSEFKTSSDLVALAYFELGEHEKVKTFLDVAAESAEIPFGITYNKEVADSLEIPTGIILLKQNDSNPVVFNEVLTLDSLRDFIAKNRVCKSQLSPGILPPHPVLTRFGTWVKAVCFYHHYWERTINFVNTLKAKKGQDFSAITRLKNLISIHGDRIKKEIDYIYNNYALLPVYITILERDDLEVEESMDVLEKVQLLLKFAADLDECAAARRVLDKFNFVRTKNSGLLDLVDACKRTNFWKYAPVSSMKIERFFSLYRIVASCRRPFRNAVNIENATLIKASLEKTPQQQKVIAD